MSKKRVVITYGTFDMFHVGHLRLLKRAKKLGDYLIVAVSTDAFNQTKNKKVLIPYDQRKEIVSNICDVDKVIPESSWEQKTDDIKRYKVDTLVMGDDWRGEFDYLKSLCEVVYVPRTRDISTTQLKKSLLNFVSIPKEDVLRAFEIIEILKSDFE
jgi:glycerol-3-phosphate cytidylyltransferase